MIPCDALVLEALRRVACNEHYLSSAVCLTVSSLLNPSQLVVFRPP